jgi:hypothetical protein
MILSASFFSPMIIILIAIIIFFSSESSESSEYPENDLLPYTQSVPISDQLVRPSLTILLHAPRFDMSDKDSRVYCQSRLVLGVYRLFSLVGAFQD